MEHEIKGETIMKKVMYHIHKIGNHDDDWVVGNIIDNRNNDTNSFYDNVLKYVPAEYLNNDLRPFDVIVESFLNSLEKGQRVSVDTLKKLLYHSRLHLHELNLSKREYILETVRKEFYPDHISRVNCIWLCNKAGLKFWLKRLNATRDIKVFKVMIDGELFASLDSKLPKLTSSTEEQIVQAHQYWNPEKLNGRRDVEYLFEGKLTILEEITIPDIEEEISTEQYFNKLVRDKIPEKIEKNNEIAITEVLDEQQYMEALKDKLFEEMLEVTNARSKKEVLEECADLLEVVESITTLAGYSKEDLEEAKRKKREKNGGFENRILLKKTMKREG